MNVNIMSFYYTLYRAENIISNVILHDKKIFLMVIFH